MQFTDEPKHAPCNGGKPLKELHPTAQHASAGQILRGALAQQNAAMIHVGNAASTPRAQNSASVVVAMMHCSRDTGDLRLFTKSPPFRCHDSPRKVICFVPFPSNYMPRLRRGETTVAWTSRTKRTGILRQNESQHWHRHDEPKKLGRQQSRTRTLCSSSITTPSGKDTGDRRLVGRGPPASN